MSHGRRQDGTTTAFLPELMMQKAELIKARRLLHKLVRIHEQSRLEEDLPKPERKGYEYFTKLRKLVWAEMEALGEWVWKREIGLERYSVIQVVREDMEFRLQVLRFSFIDDYAMRGLWAWRLDGRALRKDGTLGVNDAVAVFRVANLQRRYLDGIWRELRWPDVGKA